MTNTIYKLFSRFFFTSGIISMIEGRITILYPADRQSVVKRTVEQLFKMLMLVICMIGFFSYFSNIEPYVIFIVSITIYFVGNAYVHKQFERIEAKLLESMLKFIEAVKFRFQFDGMLEEALLDAIGECDHIMAIHGQLMYEYLRESYIKEKCDYQEISPNHYFLTFYSLCESVMKYGDKKSDEGSLFIKNLGYLKEDIHLELLKKKAIENTFMGLGGICIVPIFCIKPIEIWSVSNMPELANGYEGRMGTLITILLTVLSLIIYQVIMNLKYPTTSYNQKKKWVKHLIKTDFIRNAITRYMNRNIKKMVKMDRLLKTVGYQYNIDEFCTLRFVSSLVAAIVSGFIALTIGFGITAILFVLCGYICTYYGRVIMIHLKKQLMMMERESEIIRFQGIILMLMHADRITIDQMLLQLERFASSFKQQIEEISDKLSYKGMAVFKEYKDKSEFLPFNRIIDGFIACDDMYIYKAFEDIETDRQYYIEKHKQDNSFYIEQRGAVGKFLSFIPICMVVIVKLIIPFVIEGMNQMSISGMQL